MPITLGPELPPVTPDPLNPVVLPSSSRLNTTGTPLIVDPAIQGLLTSTQNSVIVLQPPGTISIQAAFITTAIAQLEARAQQNSESVANPLYYRSFGIGLIDFITSVSFLINNVDRFVADNNQLHDDQTSQYGAGTDILKDVNKLQDLIGQEAADAVDEMNEATTKYNQGLINQQQYNTAINKYNNTINTLNGKIQDAFNSYSVNAPIYNSFVPENNDTISFLNQYRSNFKPPPPPYELQNLLPTLQLSSLILPPVVAGSLISYTPPAMPTLPPIIPTVDKNTIEDTQVQPLADQVLEAAQALLDAGADAVAFFQALQQFGLRTQYPVPPVAQRSDKSSGSSGGSPATSAISAGDPFKEAKNLTSNFTASILKGQYGAGAPTGSALVAATGYLQSQVFSRSGQFSIFKALEILGFNVTPSGRTPVSPGQADSQSGIPAASGQAGITVRDLSFPVVSKTSEITTTELSGGIATAAALGAVSTAALLNNSSELNAAALRAITESIAGRNLTAAQQAAAADAIASSLGLQTSLSSLLALSSALGAPGLLQQFIGNLGISNLAKPSPLELALTNPAQRIFIEASLSDSIRSSLRLSQVQAEAIARAAFSSALASGNIASAQILQDALKSSLSATLIANNIAASDALNASNLALSVLSDQVRFTQIQNTVIQLDNLKYEIIDNLTKKGVQEADAIRIAQRVVEQNRDLIRQQVIASDDNARTIANNALQASITSSLGSAGVSADVAASAGSEVTSQLAAINPATSALASPTTGAILPPEVLANELKTLIIHKLEPLVGQQQAAAVADEYASTILTSPNSLLNVTRDQIDTYREKVADTQDATLADLFNAYLAPTQETWLVARLFTDPGQLVTHSAATGIMYSQPVAIKNTPPVMLV